MFPAKFGIGTCLVVTCLLQPCTAQLPDAKDLLKQFNAILNDEGLSRLERVRSLQATLELEEKRLVRDAVKLWIDQLGDDEFDSRERAQNNLIEAGETSIAEVAQAVKQSDREPASRCLVILAKIAEGNHEVAAKQALDALRLLAKGQTPIELRAADILAKVTETDIDRALVTLKELEVRVHKNTVGEVTSVSDFRGNITDRELKLLAAFPRLARLTLSSKQVTDAGLAELSNLKSLSSLTLMQASITDAGIAKLATLKRLSTLSLNCETITSSGLLKLGDSKSLQMLTLLHFELTPQDIEILRGLKVEKLCLMLRKVSDEDLDSIGKITKMYFLTISDSPDLTNKSLAAISSIKLSSLNLSNSKITDDGLEHLKEMKSLTSLYLKGKLLTDQGLEHLSGLKNLRILSVRGTSISKKGADKLQAILPNLQRVYR